MTERELDRVWAALRQELNISPAGRQQIEAVCTDLLSSIRMVEHMQRSVGVWVKRVEELEGLFQTQITREQQRQQERDKAEDELERLQAELRRARMVGPL